MNGKERVLAAMALTPTDRVPWVPFVGCHAGSLIGKNATEFLQSTDAMVAGLNAAITRYHPDGIPVAFDLQIEAEVLGCQLAWAEQNPPAVISHPLTTGTKLSDLALPQADQGRMPIVLEVARRLRKEHPDLALYGLITGPFTLAMHLAGTDVFMQMCTEPHLVHELMTFCRDVAKQMCTLYIEAGCDIIAVVDPMTSQIGPDQFTEFVTPYCKAVFDHIRAHKARSSFFVCGFAQQNIEVMCDCGPDNVSIDENIPLDYVRDVCLSRGISFGGNMQLTVVLLNGTRADTARNTLDCIQRGGTQGFILAPGCDLPYATPPENIEVAAALVADPYNKEIVALLEESVAATDTLNMGEYGKTGKVVIDIITLDSEACAPCQYMVEAVRQIAPQFDGIVQWREHKIKNREAVTFMSSLMVKNIPTICIDGKITFISKIPPREELVAAIQKRVNEKLRLKINSRKGSITLFGQERTTAPLKAAVERACRELGADDMVIEQSSDSARMQEFGIFTEPALVVTSHAVKCQGEVPSGDVLKEWIKGIM